MPSRNGDADPLAWEGDDDPTLIRERDTGGVPVILPESGQASGSDPGSTSDPTPASSDAEPVATPASDAPSTSASEPRAESVSEARTDTLPDTDTVPNAGTGTAVRGDETADSRAAATTDPSDTDPAASVATRQAVSNAMLITVGVFAGAYLLFTLGWIIGGLRFSETDTVRFLISPVAFQVNLWLAVFAAPIWFFTTLIVTRKSKRWARLLWLLIGLVLLVPWPFVLIGAIGQ